MRGTKTERRPGVWKLRVYVGVGPNGGPIQVTRTIDTTGGNPNAKPGSGSRRADRELAKMVAEVTAGRLSSRPITVDQLVERWLGHVEQVGHSPTTVREYRSIARRSVRPAIGHIRLDKLAAADLDQLYGQLGNEGRSSATIRRVHSLISAALHQGERWELVAQNVARRATPPPVRSAPVRAPTPAEVQTLLAHAKQLDESLARMLLIAALTGCRRGELCALRWTDIDWEAQAVRVARSVFEVAGGGWSEKSTKTHQERRIALDGLAVETLRQQHQQVSALADQLGLTALPGGFVFSPSPDGAEPTRPDALTRFARRAAARAGVSTHLHALRHFAATQGIAAGTDVVTMAGRLGHRDPSITLRVYSHVLEQRDRAAAEAIGATLRQPPKDDSGG
jgi:integrase